MLAIAASQAAACGAAVAAVAAFDARTHIMTGGSHRRDGGWPIGTSVAWQGSAERVGWLPCDGAATVLFIAPVLMACMSLTPNALVADVGQYFICCALAIGWRA